MSEPVYLVSETLKYSDGSEKVVTFKPIEKLEEVEETVELLEEEPVKALVEEDNSIVDPFAKEVEETPSGETE